MDRYPESIVERLSSLSHAGPADEEENSSGVSADFNCGASVSVSLSIDDATKLIKRVSYTSNACGFSLAFAEDIASFIEGRTLTDLRGDWQTECYAKFSDDVGSMPAFRMSCLAMVADAYGNALRRYREGSLLKFEGDSPLVCSCFSVSEDVLEALLASGEASTVARLTELTNAGSGCGSCLMILREMVESRQHRI
jgi:bacterioferritin-associated ferredoxin/NifU-like protein involved in Fe-S cluster formation